MCVNRLCHHNETEDSVSSPKRSQACSRSVGTGWEPTPSASHVHHAGRSPGEESFLHRTTFCEALERLDKVVPAWGWRFLYNLPALWLQSVHVMALTQYLLVTMSFMAIVCCLLLLNNVSSLMQEITEQRRSIHK